SNVATERQCASNLEYDLILEKASSGTIVNKQNGDSLFVNVKVSNDASLNFGYDSNAFNLINGNCLTGNFNAGDNPCKFDVAGNPNRYSFTLGDDSGVVEIIENPYTIYVTNAEQLYKRFDDKKGVDVLLAKTYEKASLKKGIVYDLSLELTESHPFSYAFNLYNQKLSPFGTFDNLYALTAAKFVRNKCNNCKETIIVGDDYVVPSSINNDYLRNGINFGGNFFSDEITNNYYSDSDYSTRKNDYNIADLQHLFNYYNEGKEQFEEGKKVTIILPENINQNLTDAIDRLKYTLEENFGNLDLVLVNSNEIYSDSFNRLGKTRGRTIIIIGDIENNRALNSYPKYIEKDSISLEPSVWDKDEYSLILNTMDPEILDIYSLMIYTGMYKEIQEKSASVWDRGIPISGGVMIIVGIGASIVPGGQAIGVPLIIAGFALDGASVANECWIKNEGGGNWGNCALDVGITIASFGIGKWVVGPLVEDFGPIIAKKIGKTLLSLKFVADERIVREIIEEGAETAIKQADNAKYLSDGIELGTSLTGKNIDEILRGLPNDIPTKNKLRLLKSTGIIKNIENANDPIKKALTGQKGFIFEVEATESLFSSGENIRKVSEKFFDPSNPKNLLTEIDAISDTKIFEFKGRDWGLKVPGTIEGNDFIKDMNTKFKSYGTYLSHNGMDNHERILVFEFFVDGPLKIELEKIGWKVTTI
ncbi:MAG: hypothetical protein KJ674_04505, partial [Nanoarchaeota archaeon]|nr:hypothetical protein [Nanoarchaeota archaeon]